MATTLTTLLSLRSPNAATFTRPRGAKVVVRPRLDPRLGSCSLATVPCAKPLSARRPRGPGPVAFKEESKETVEAAPIDESLRVYHFIKGDSPGNKDLKWLLGGKGANLCEMAKIGLNVPPGMTITTRVCQQYYEAGGRLPDGVLAEVYATLAKVEGARRQKFADTNGDPLLLSVRSGAAASMPGMMNTVLNLGMNDTVCAAMVEKHGKRFAMDCYRRLLDMYADVVLSVDHDEFEAELVKIKDAHGVKLDTELDADGMEEVVAAYKAVYKREGIVLPDDPKEQLNEAIEAVFRSWNVPRAVKYREISNITGLLGTAVNVQSMVYGNYNDESGSGVFFTRSPATGEPKIYGEYVINGQGEDVVAGIRTPLPIEHMKTDFNGDTYDELIDICRILEVNQKDMQDCEFTVQDGELFMLQTRNGKRTGHAALRIAVDMVEEGLVAKDQAIHMVEPRHLEMTLHPQFVKPEAYVDDVIAHGLNASPGAAVGRAVFTAAAAEHQFHNGGDPVLLIREETCPDDVGGMHAAEGILTARGGMASHAAVVARGWGKPCVCGCGELHVDSVGKKVTVTVPDASPVVIREGDWVSINGTTGEVILGRQEVQRPRIAGGLAKFMSWVDARATLGVWANADTPADAEAARAAGAVGLGLVRTEHMFFSSAERIAAMRRLIAAEEVGADCDAPLASLQDYQREDFEGIFRAMDGMPVTVRLLDPPLHEFLPHEGRDLDNMCRDLAYALPKMDWVSMRAKVQGLREANPMMGFRGCRLGLVHPDITEMQVAAMINAACDVMADKVAVDLEIMVPLVSAATELERSVEIIRRTAEAVMKERGTVVPYQVGTMIETPRGALRAGELAKTAEFFSIGSNDLTQMTYGFSRDDAEQKFLKMYIKEGILPNDPFETLDPEGVGELIELAVARGRAARPGIRVGLCGEHGGDPGSVAVAAAAGVDYVSCSPLRVPVARLAAAQAALDAGAASRTD